MFVYLLMQTTASSKLTLACVWSHTEPSTLCMSSLDFIKHENSFAERVSSFPVESPFVSKRVICVCILKQDTARQISASEHPDSRKVKLINI